MDPQSLNRYSYTRNNPVNRIDPDGQADIGVNPDVVRQLSSGPTGYVDGTSVALVGSG